MLVDKKGEAENVVSLFFKPVDNLSFSFIPGQYVNVRPQSISGHGKSYTISSSPHEKLISLTIKRMGTVSSALIDLPLHETLFLEGPHGYFYPEEHFDDLVMIAGGIGITPFYSIIKDKLRQSDAARIVLLYSNKTAGDIVFFKELHELARNHACLNIVYCLTQEKTKHPLVQEYSRIDKKMFKKYVAASINGRKRCYICGSIQFVQALWNMVKGVGVREEHIFTESFY